MNILLSGSNGLVGSELKDLLSNKGHQIVKLIRNQKSENESSVYWDYINKNIDLESLEGVNCVIHLAGENISGKRWSQKQKQKILDSRIQSTDFLIKSLLKLKHKPDTFICASAVGFYGNRGEEVLSEKSVKGAGFLSDVCEDWEKSTNAANEAGIRVINLRFGVIFSEKGGALKKMITPFKFGLGGKIGSGNQYISWISLLDTIRAVEFCLSNKQILGPVNIVSPNPITNYELTKSLGKYLKRPTLFPLPAVVAKMVLGEMAEELLLTSTRVNPKILLLHKFEFKHNRLEDFLNL